MFPALSVLSYRTVLLQNCGDLPLTFCLDHSSNPAWAESVSVVPSCGLIQPGNHQILTLRTTPTEECPKQGFSLHLQLNAAKHTKVLYTLHRNTEAVALTTLFLQNFQSETSSPCPLGTDSSQCGGKAVCISGRRWLFIFPANSGGLTDAALPPHQEPQQPTSLVGWHNGCYSSAVYLTFVGVLFVGWTYPNIINLVYSGLLWLSFLIGSNGAFQSQTRSLSLLNQMLVNCIPMRAQWETEIIIHIFMQAETVQLIKKFLATDFIYLFYLLLFVTGWRYRSRYGLSAHWQRKHTQSNPLSPSGQSRLLGVISHILPLKWWEWALKAS